MKQENLQATGTVIQELGDTKFKVTLDSGIDIICTISGKIRKNFIKIMAGDKVTIEMSPYDLTKGRITRRGVDNGENNKKPESSKNNNNSNKSFKKKKK